MTSMRAGGPTGDLRQVQRAHDQLRAEVARLVARVRVLEEENKALKKRVESIENGQGN